jgi:hypothetical protein
VNLTMSWLSLLHKRVVSADASEVTASLKALKTLSCEAGRVSIAPEEVLDRPGYLEARRAAASLTRQLEKGRAVTSVWDRMEMEHLVGLVSASLLHSREQGASVDQALLALHGVLTKAHA